MSDAEKALAAIAAEAHGRRSALRDQVQDLRARAAPKRLASETIEGAKTQSRALATEMRDHVRAHPVAVAVGATALVGWFLRKPILQFAPPQIRRAYDMAAGHLPFSFGAPSPVVEPEDGRSIEDNTPNVAPDDSSPQN
jgi:ElaB/YqjD/DUF883 family membrane-anchored ribosome-binding protein